LADRQILRSASHALKSTPTLAEGTLAPHSRVLTENDSAACSMGASVGTGGNGASEDEVLLQVGSAIRHVDAKAIVLIDRQQRRRETREGVDPGPSSHRSSLSRYESSRWGENNRLIMCHLWRALLQIHRGGPRALRISGRTLNMRGSYDQLKRCPPMGLIVATASGPRDGFMWVHFGPRPRVRHCDSARSITHPESNILCSGMRPCGIALD
jgi:hypothetical protein